MSFCCYPCAAEQLYVEKAASLYEKRMAAAFEQGGMGGEGRVSPGMGMMGQGQSSVVNVSLSPTPP